MTVETTTVKVSGNGNDSATSFSFSPVVIFASTDLVVTLVESDGTETVLTEGSGATNYAVVVSSYPGTGSITYPADTVTPMATGDKVVMKRTLTLEQLTDLSNQGAYNPETQETQFDKLVMIDIQQQEEINRCLKGTVGEPNVTSWELPNTDTASAGDIPALSSDKTGLGWASGAGTLPDPVTVARGGTGATAAAGARTNLGAQAQGDVLDDLNTLGVNAADSEFLVGTGAGAFAWESGATVRTSLGLGIDIDVLSPNAPSSEASCADAKLPAYV